MAEFAAQYLSDVTSVKVAVTEAVSNAVKYAYRGESPGEITVEAERRDNGVVVEVSDSGVGLRPTLGSEGLRVGLQLIGVLADRFMLDTGSRGTTVRMLFASQRRRA